MGLPRLRSGAGCAERLNVGIGLVERSSREEIDQFAEGRLDRVAAYVGDRAK